MMKLPFLMSVFYFLKVGSFFPSDLQWPMLALKRHIYIYESKIYWCNSFKSYSSFLVILMYKISVVFVCLQNCSSKRALISSPHNLLLQLHPTPHSFLLRLSVWDDLCWSSAVWSLQHQQLSSSHLWSGKAKRKRFIISLARLLFMVVSQRCRCRQI